MKKLIIGMLLVMSQASFADVACHLSVSLDVSANVINARLLETPDEYTNIPLENNKSCSENFLIILKEGQKFTELEGIKVPIIYSYTLKVNENEDYLKKATKNAKIGGFEVVLSEDASTLKAMPQSQE